jgi:hypothetical protein
MEKWFDIAVHVLIVVLLWEVYDKVKTIIRMKEREIDAE